ncbi:MAG TPA: DUF2809 domain-containing protein [Candidatus Cloacimonadota bacterium]|nr:DUF2809 domain-containing protein [Candidatus Cloacimonadota bacterium]HPT71297.1 DUF2809 domain-containing protein [Candidatus Cloacimonadota bacterium]
MSRRSNSHRLIDTFAIMSVIIVLGMGTKYYQGTFHEWVNGSLSGVVYSIFWCLVLSLPGIWKFKDIALVVFIVCCIIEFLQLWHPAFLTTIRSFQAGGALFGTVFQWKDFIYYAIGSWLGYKLIRQLAR